MRGERFRNGVITTVAALLSATAILIDLTPTQIPTESVAAVGLWGHLEKILQMLTWSLKAGKLVMALVFVALIPLFYRWLAKGGRLTWRDAPAPLFSALMLVAGAVRCGRSVASLWDSNVQIIKACVFFVGMVLLWTALLRALYAALRRETATARGFRHALGTPMLLLSAVWLPQIVLRYPGVIFWDTFNELEQFYGQWPFTAHHPPAHTVLCGVFMRLGETFAHPEVGLYLLMLLQTAAMLLVLSYMLSTMQRFGAPGWLYYGTLLVYALAPIYASYATVIIKDTPFAVAMLLYFIQLARLARDRQAFFRSPRELVLLGLACFVAILSRKNGAYVILPTMLICLISQALRKWPLRRWGALALTTVLAAAAAAGVDAALAARYDIKPASIREAFSLPFQQTARVLSLHRNDVSAEDFAVIDRVLDAEYIGKHYVSDLSDKVKDTFRDDSTLAERLEYAKLWLRQGLAYPVEYTDAIFHMQGRMLDPTEVQANFCRHEVWRPINGSETYYWYKDAAVYGPGEVLAEWYDLSDDLPLLGLVENLPIHVYLVLALGCFFLYERRRGALMVWLPVLLCVGVSILSPVCVTRYSLPIFYAAPVLLFMMDTPLCPISAVSTTSHTMPSAPPSKA